MHTLLSRSFKLQGKFKLNICKCIDSTIRVNCFINQRMLLKREYKKNKRFFRIFLYLPIEKPLNCILVLCFGGLISQTWIRRSYQPVGWLIALFFDSFVLAKLIRFTLYLKPLLLIGFEHRLTLFGYKSSQFYFILNRFWSVFTIVCANLHFQFV